tara:strand:+ start:68 stop:1258 length:1191 start_codon:yes stop_codon:yes gene_type:complete
MLFSSISHATDYSVSHNPYEDVNFNTTLRCLAQLHDHVNNNDPRVSSYDDAEYCAVTWMDYAGYYGNDTGLLVGMGSPKQWPPEDYGATAIPSLDNIKFYIPGAEEGGYLKDNITFAHHTHSTFMTEYIESAGCSTCNGGSAAPLTPTVGVPSNRLYETEQELVDLVNELGGWPIYNHPSVGPNTGLTGYKGIEIMNTFMSLRDQKDNEDSAGTGTRLTNARALWDTWLETVSARIYAVAVNDHYGPDHTVGVGTGGGSVPDDLVANDIDQGKIEVLLTVQDLEAFESSVRAGAFFAVHENETASKGAFPEVTNIVVGSNSITLTTTAGNETVRWIANGSSVGTNSFTLSLFGLDAGLKYVRAEIDDGSGRITYTQAFELVSPSPVHHSGFGEMGR